MGAGAQQGSENGDAEIVAPGDLRGATGAGWLLTVGKCFADDLLALGVQLSITHRSSVRLRGVRTAGPLPVWPQECEPSNQYTYEVYHCPVQFLILGLLLQGPHSGYDLRKQFTSAISLFYSASLGSIQRSLGLLDARGWVTKQETVGSGRPRHLYSITESGRQAWRDWMLAPLTEPHAEQTALAKVYLLGCMPSEDRSESLDLLRSRAAADLDRLVALRAMTDVAQVPEQMREAVRFRLATLDYGIRAHELMMRWLSELESA